MDAQAKFARYADTQRKTSIIENSMLNISSKPNVAKYVSFVETWTVPSFMKNMIWNNLALF